MKRNLLVALAGMMALTLLVGCRDSLQTAINDFYEAEKNRDWNTWSSMVEPTLLQDEFKADLLQMTNTWFTYDLVAWKVLSIEDAPSVPDDKGHSFKSVKVVMDVTIRSKRSDELEKRRDATDYWLFRDGKWYWYYTGNSSSEKGRAANNGVHRTLVPRRQTDVERALERGPSADDSRRSLNSMRATCLVTTAASIAAFMLGVMDGGERLGDAVAGVMLIGGILTLIVMPMFFRCPKCRKSILEGPTVEICGHVWHYRTPIPARRCRFCGEMIE